MSKNNSIKQDNNSENWKEQEVVDWSSTEGYEEVKRVNDFLRWPALWGSKKSKNKPRIIIDKPEKQKPPKDKTKLVSSKPQPIVESITKIDQSKSDLTKKKSQFKLLSRTKHQAKIDHQPVGKDSLESKIVKTSPDTQLISETKLVEKPKIELVKDNQVRSQPELTTKVESIVSPIDQLAEDKLVKEVKKDLVEEVKIEPSLKKEQIKLEADNLVKAELGQLDKLPTTKVEIKELAKTEILKTIDQQVLIESKESSLAKDQESVIVEPKIGWRQKMLEQRAMRRLRRANQLRNRQLKQVITSGQSSFQDKEAQRQAIVKQATQVSQIIDSPKKSVVEPAPDQSKSKQSELVKPDSSKKSELSTAPSNKVSGSTVKLSIDQQQRFQDLKQSLEQKSWSRPAITEVNLAKDQMTLYFNWNKFWTDLTQWLVVTLFFLSLCGALFYLWRQNQDKQAGDVTKHLARANQLITLTENEVSGVLDFRSRVQVISDLLNQHIYWSNFFNFLEKNTLPNVFYQDFVGNTNGEYIFKARTDSFDSMAKQLKVFRQAPEVLEVSSEGGEMVKSEVIDPDDENRVAESSTQLNFSIRIKINPELFSF